MVCGSACVRVIDCELQESQGLKTWNPSQQLVSSNSPTDVTWARTTPSKHKSDSLNGFWILFNTNIKSQKPPHPTPLWESPPSTAEIPEQLRFLYLDFSSTATRGNRLNKSCFMWLPLLFLSRGLIDRVAPCLHVLSLTWTPPHPDHNPSCATISQTGDREGLNPVNSKALHGNGGGVEK